MAHAADIISSPRLLLGPGPSMVHPRVLRAMATPPVGHMDPQFFAIMDETQGLLIFYGNFRPALQIIGKDSQIARGDLGSRFLGSGCRKAGQL